MRGHWSDSSLGVWIVLGLGAVVLWRHLRLLSACCRTPGRLAGVAPRRRYERTAEGGWREPGDPGPSRPADLVRQDADVWGGI